MAHKQKPKLEIELPCNPAIPLLGIDGRVPKTQCGKDFCTLVFMAALLDAFCDAVPIHLSRDGNGEHKEGHHSPQDS